MKKLIILTLILFAMYFGIQVSFRYFSKGFEETYEIKKDEKIYTIYEKYTNEKNIIDNYYFEIKTDSNTFYLQTYKNFGRKQKIVSDLVVYKDNTYECILPVFRGNQIIMDFKCLSNNVIYDYSQIKGRSTELDNFVKNTKEYNVEQFTGKDEVKVQRDYVIAYKNNLSQNHVIAINSYKGIYTINTDNVNTIYDAKPFNVDIYKRPISAYVDNYYLVANYNDKYAFSNFYLINIKNDRITEIKTNYQISFNSYIQGILDKMVYVVDKDNKKQYKIDIDNKTISDITTGNLAGHYNNGEWENIDINVLAREERKFNIKDEIDITDNSYSKIVKVGEYYYFYRQNGRKYQVYRSTVKNKDQLTYLFDVDSYNKIQYVDDYIYYIDGKNINYYSDATGKRTLLSNNELQFNDDLQFIAIKK